MNSTQQETARAYQIASAMAEEATEQEAVEQTAYMAAAAQRAAEATEQAARQAHQVAADAHRAAAQASKTVGAFWKLEAVVTDDEVLMKVEQEAIEAEWMAAAAAQRASKSANDLAEDAASGWAAWQAEDQPSGSQDAIDASNHAADMHQAMANGQPQPIDPEDEADWRELTNS
jgi:hypothetical protein